MVEAKRRAFIFIVIAFVLAIIVAGMVINKLNAYGQSNQERMIKVATASRDIKSYEAIKPSDIKWVEVPINDKIQAMIISSSEIKNVITVVDLKKGDLLTKNTIVRQTNLSPNHRLVMLNNTPNVVMDEDLKVGDRVDVFVVLENQGKVETNLVFRGLKVAQIDSNLSGEKKQQSPIVKVSITMEDAQKLINYQNVAKQIRVLRDTSSNG